MTLMVTDVGSAAAQTGELLLLPAATDISTVEWKSKIYRFPSFQKGKITYTKGFVLDYEFDLNYNLYFEKIDFINSSGDTLNITNTREIKGVQIGDKWFIHDLKTGYCEVILSLPVGLAMKKHFVFEHLGHVEVAYKTVERGPPATEARGIVTDYDRFYNISETYFLVDNDNKVHKATKASLLKLFPDHSRQIKDYLVERQVNFDSRDDLVALLTYCDQFVSSPSNRK